METQPIRPLDPLQLSIDLAPAAQRHGQLQELSSSAQRIPKVARWEQTWGQVGTANLLQLVQHQVAPSDVQRDLKHVCLLHTVADKDAGVHTQHLSQSSSKERRLCVAIGGDELESTTVQVPHLVHCHWS